MTTPPIRFDDGAAYERMMGQWSRRVGEVFLDWLSPPAGQDWLDVGCGSGAFTELIVERCAPAAVHGIDPAEGQLVYARTRPAARLAKFHLGDAMALPFADGDFGVAVMALVIFFVPEPARGVAEMVRVVRPGGRVAAYAWDVLGGGFPLDPIYQELRALGVEPPLPPSVHASRLDALEALWRDAGLESVAVREIMVQRTFADFEDFWSTSRNSSSLRAVLEALPGDAMAHLVARLRQRLPADAEGRITYGARANAVVGAKGRR